MTKTTLAILAALVCGHLFARNARPDDRIVEFGKDGTIVYPDGKPTPRKPSTIVVPRKPAPAVKSDTSVTIRPDGAILKTDADGFTVVITPGPIQPGQPATEDFCGYQIPSTPPNCIGAYDASQQKYLDMSFRYNAEQNRHREAMARANRANNYGNRSGFARPRIVYTKPLR